MMMRCLLIICTLLLCACSQQVQQTQSDYIESLGNGIYVHYGKHLDIDDGYQGDICNTSFVVGGNGVAVIDTGGSLKVGQQLKAAIRSVTDKPILYVINTHVHPDHVFGNAAFKDEKGVTFVGHHKLAEALTLREEAYTRLNERFLGEDANGTEIVLPTMSIDGTTGINLGGRVLTMQVHDVAHTDTDLTVIDQQTKTLFAGDLLFIERTPVIEGDIKGLITTIDHLKTYDVQQVVPGHGPATKDWQQALDNAKRYLTVVLNDVREIINNDGSMEEAMDKAGASEKDNWVLFNIANRRNINTIYPALEWE